MKESGEPVNIEVVAGVGVRAARSDDGAVTVVRVVDASDQQLSAQVRDDGSVWVRIEGTGIPGKIDEVPVCKILVDLLNQQRREWAEPKAWPESEREEGVDVVAERLDGGSPPLKFQVTRLDPDTTLWKDLATKGVAEKIYPSIDAIADALRDAISKKRRQPQDGIILVLNGTQLPVGLPAMRSSFTTRHGEWLQKEFRFDQVWVVEPFVDAAWTFRIDTVDPRGPKGK